MVPMIDFTLVESELETSQLRQFVNSEPQSIDFPEDLTPSDDTLFFLRMFARAV